MVNLLAEGYRRLFKGKRFYIVLAVIVGVAAFVLTLVTILSSTFDDSASPKADGMLFMMTGTMPLLISIAAGLLIVQDFRNNTIRNKIIVGHSRTNIYLASLIVSITVAVIYQFAFWLTVIGLGSILMGFNEFPSKAIFVNMFVALVIQLTFTAVIVFLCNSMKNIGGFVISLTMHYIVSMLSAFLLFVKSEKVQELITELVPSYQVNIVEYGYTEVPEHLPVILLADLAIIVVTTIGGILIFNKSDLK